MKWFTCIISWPQHIHSVQMFHTRAETPEQAESNALRWIMDGEPKMEDSAYRDMIDVPFVFEGKLEPVEEKAIAALNRRPA